MAQVGVAPQSSHPPAAGEAIDGRHSHVIAFASLYAVAVALLFASRVREFADESDNLLGGVLLVRGQRLYADYFSSHMPLAYYIAALPAVFGAVSLDQFRFFSNLLLVGATLMIVWAFRNDLPLPLLGIWATATVFAHNLQWGEMLTASTIAGFGVLAAGLIFYCSGNLRFSPRQQVGLSAATFIAVQSELVAVFPLLLLGLAFICVRVVEVLRRRSSPANAVRATTILLAAISAPHAVLLLSFWLSGSLPDFVFDAYQFNVTDYSRFVMNSSVLGMLHDWEAQYRTYVMLNLRDPLGVQACLIFANFLAAWVVFTRRGILVAALYYLFVALTHVRNEGAYYLCSYFSLALVLQYALDSIRARHKFVSGIGIAAAGVLTLNFVVQVAGTYDFMRRPIVSPDAGILQAVTTMGEKTFVAPYDPYVYLASDRMPASRYSFYFPWQAIEPRSENALMDELRERRPPVIFFHRDELVNGQWRLGDYGQRVYRFLISQGYVPLDAEVAVDVLIRSDRVNDARQRLGLES